LEAGIGQHRPAETTQIYARDGQTLLYELVDPQGGRRTVVELARMPKALRDATIAVEDANFYDNPGVDLRGILRALLQNYQSQDVVSGASTITQQLVRNVLLPPEERTRISFERKLREAILALRVSRKYSKDQILGIYLNEVYYGNQAYGVEHHLPPGPRHTDPSQRLHQLCHRERVDRSDQRCVGSGSSA